MNKFLTKLPFYLSIALAFVLSIKNLREPDLWWQIRTGQWILAHNQVPKTDFFSFTHFGQSWINIKWGFEVLAALLSDAFGPASVFILQMACSVLILFFLKKILDLLELFDPNSLFIASFIILFSIEFRLIGRPEMFTHLFIVISLYIHLFAKHKNAKSLWWLIPLQVLWTNLHEAYGLGIVIAGIFLVWNLLESRLHKTTFSFIPILAFLATLASVAINPRGLLLYKKAIDIYFQVNENKFTSELSSITSNLYWQKESFVFMLVLILIFVSLFILKKQQRLNKLIQTFTPAYFILLLAMTFLALSAYRNIALFFLVAFPLLVWHIKHFFPKSISWSKSLSIIGVFSYILVVSNTYYKFTHSRDRFGLEVLSTNNPIGAAQYIEQKGLTQKKGFADYLSSSYLLWKLQPNFKTYIDLRDLDVFPKSFFNSYLTLIQEPTKFHALDLKEKFDYVVLFRKTAEPIHRYLYTDTLFACTYADAVAAVYEKTDNFVPGDIFSPLPATENEALPQLINKLFNPLYKSFDYDLVDNDIYAAEYYLNVGRLSLAENRIKKYMNGNTMPSKEGLAIQQKIEEFKKGFLNKK